MSEQIDKLERENQRLSALAEHDWLTGIYNRGAVQEKITELLQKDQSGALFVCDIDNFKRINDTFGHISGDMVLRKVAKILQAMAVPSGLVGRIGGDEFVMFLAGPKDAQFVEERCLQLENRLRSNDVTELCAQFSASVCGSLYQPGDDYLALFDRADLCLLKKKRVLKKRGKGMEPPKHTKESGDSLSIDAELIYTDLKESGLTPGALCCDYDTFRALFRFMERRLVRRKEQLCLLFFTLTDDKGNAPSLQYRFQQTTLLQTVLQNTLRLGDVYTQYTEFQFLVMLSDADDQIAEQIAARIHANFFHMVSAIQSGVLLHHSFPLHAATLDKQ